MLNKNELNHLPKILKWYQFTTLVIMALIFALIFSFIPNSSFWGIFWGFFIILVLPIFIILMIENHAITFVFDDDKITINSGVVAKSSKIMPFDKVQNVNVKTGALLGTFGLSEISIWTASQSQMGNQGETKPDGKLKLKKEDSKILAEIILKKK